ncbi:MAG: FecR family protein [Beijerinckiaceae bacterium]
MSSVTMKHVRLRHATAALVVAAACGMAGGAHAQAVIGDAARAVNDVTGQLGSRRVAITSGSAVHQNETVSTGRAASASLRFLDATSLDVSPGSSVKLDRYIYNAGGSARGAVMTMTRGAFRFATGQSDPSAFRLQTPQAIIGIRGTVLDVEVERGVSHVTLQRGAIEVCPRNNRRACAILTQPGQSVSVTATRIVGDDPAVVPPAPPRGPLTPGIIQPGGGGVIIGPDPARSGPNLAPGFNFPPGGGGGRGGNRG